VSDLADRAVRDIRYRDKQWLDEMYWGQKLSSVDIAELCNCSQSTVRDWMEKHGIERRSKSVALQNKHASFGTNADGRECWRSHSRETDGRPNVFVHRLLAVSEYGLESVTDNVVHHKNEIPWDNRPQNIVLLSDAEHKQHHAERADRDERGVFV
jgi:hypothetical protein